MEKREGKVVLNISKKGKGELKLLIKRIYTIINII